MGTTVLDDRLVASLSGHMAVAMRGLDNELAPTLNESTRRFLQQLARRACRQTDDVALVLGAAIRADTQLQPIDVVDALRRALRLSTPWLKAARAQIHLDVDAEPAWIEADTGAVLRLWLTLVGAACGGADAGLIVRIALQPRKSDDRVRLAIEHPAAPEELDPEAMELAARLGAELRWLPNGDGARWAELCFNQRIEPPRQEVAAAAIEPTAEAPAKALVDPAPQQGGSPGLLVPLPLPAFPTVMRDDNAKVIIERVESLAAEAMAEFLERDPRRVLVVDDEAALLNLFGELLPTIAADVKLASSCQQALDLVRAERFSLAIIDKHLPGTTGHELLRQLREIDPYLGAVMITGYVSASAISEALALGFHDFIEKPFGEIDELLSRIDVALRRNTLQSRAARLANRLDGILGILDGVSWVADARVERVRRLLVLADPRLSPSQVVTLCSDDVAVALSHPPVEGAVFDRAANAEALRRRVEEAETRPDLIVVDPVRWPGTIGELVALGRNILGNSSERSADVFVVTDRECLEAASESLEAGVAEYVLRSGADTEHIRRRLSGALQRQRLRRRDRAIIGELLQLDVDKVSAPIAARAARGEPR